MIGSVGHGLLANPTCLGVFLIRALDSTVRVERRTKSYSNLTPLIWRDNYPQCGESHDLPQDLGWQTLELTLVWSMTRKYLHSSIPTVKAV